MTAGLAAPSGGASGAGSGSGASGGLAIYDSGLKSGFQDGSWATRNLKDTAYVLQGSGVVVSFQPSNWAGLQFSHTPAVALGNYSNIDLWVNGGGSGGQAIYLGVVDQNAKNTSVSLNNYVPNQVFSPNAWVHASVPLADLGAPTTLQSVFLQGGGQSQATFYVDQLTLTEKSGSSTGTTYSGTGGGSTTGGGNASGGLYDGNTTGPTTPLLPTSFLHPLFANHMVLQHDAARVYGWTDAQAQVSVEIPELSRRVTTTADANGTWLADLGSIPVGGPYTVNVTGPAECNPHGCIGGRCLVDIRSIQLWLSLGRYQCQ